MGQETVSITLVVKNIDEVRYKVMRVENAIAELDEALGDLNDTGLILATPERGED